MSQEFIEMQKPLIWLNSFNEQIILNHYKKSERYKHMLISEFGLTCINLCRITIRPSNTKKLCKQLVLSSYHGTVFDWVQCVVTIPKSHGVSLLSALCKGDLLVCKFLPKLHNCPDSSPDGLYPSWYKTLLTLLLIHLVLGTGLFVLFVFI